MLLKTSSRLHKSFNILFEIKEYPIEKWTTACDSKYLSRMKLAVNRPQRQVSISSKIQPVQVEGIYGRRWSVTLSTVCLTSVLYRVRGHDFKFISSCSSSSSNAVQQYHCYSAIVIFVLIFARRSSTPFLSPTDRRTFGCTVIQWEHPCCH